MDDSWRFRSSIPGDICPTCSTPHFPFCPPPPAFDRNGYPIDNLRRFPPDNHPPFHRPLHHPPFHRPLHHPPFHRPLHHPPFPDLRPPPPPAVRPPEHWGGRPPLELEPLPPALNPAHRYFPDEFLESRKRMRVEDPPAIGNFPPLQPFNRYDFASDWISSDEQRRLNLIRSHGRQSAAPAYEGGTLDQHRSTGMDPNFHGPAAMNGTVLPPEPVFSHQSHPSFEGKPSFPLDLSSQSIDRFVPQERRDFQRGEFETSRNGAFTPQGGEFPPYGRNSSRNTSLQLHRSYTHVDPIERSENFVASAPQNYRHGDPIERSENYAAPAPPSYTHEDPGGRTKNYVAPAPLSYRHSNPNESTEKFAARVPEQQPLYDPHLSASYTAPTPNFAPPDPYEKYPAHDRQHLNENSSFVLPKQQLQYPGFDDNRLLPPNMGNHELESSHPYHSMWHPVENKEDTQKSMLPYNQHVEVMRAHLEPWPPIQEDTHRPFQPQPYLEVEQSSGPSISKQGGYLPMPGQVNNSQTYHPLPPQSPPPIHPEPPPLSLQVTLPLPAASRMISSASVSTPASMPHPPNAHNFSEPHPLPHADIDRETTVHASSGFTTEVIHQTPPKQYPEDGGQKFPSKLSFKDKPTVVDAHHLFKQPHRAFRPDHIVIILRGLPGSGKSYLAKALREIEVENGGTAPRIHAMDDYFMIEVEKVEDNDGSKSSTLLRGKKQITKKVIEYCYEPEMEEAYRSSMLKAFKKTLDEGIFTFIIVDDRNLRVADFAQFWANAKRSGYEVYLLEASYKDPAGCAARNVHGFTLDDIQKMAQQWEEAPSLYLQLDIQSLFHGDDLNEQSIKEVDMDTDDTACDEEDMRQLQDGNGPKITGSKSLDYALDGLVKVGDRWNTEEDEEVAEVKKLERSKWSKDLDEDIENRGDAKDSSNALSGLIQAYGKGEKSVHWGDRVNKRGFSITAVKKRSISSLVIGPGSGYNLHSNPLLEEEVTVEAAGRSNIIDSKRRFHEQLLAERESFKAVFDRRRQRIGGLFAAEDE